MSSISQDDQPTPPIWDSSKPWRQGSVIPSESAITLGLTDRECPNQFAMVITHDCDCVMDEINEPALEIMIGSRIEEAEFNGSVAFGKSTRKLHIELSEWGKFIEIYAPTRTMIPKAALRDIAPQEGWTFTPDEKRTLCRWLAARYDRPSFPNELVHRIGPVQEIFRSAAKKDGTNVVGIFVDFEPKAELQPDGMEPYEFTIIVVYSPNKPGAKEAALRISKKIKRKFESQYKVLDTEAGLQWSGIELVTCIAASWIQFTYADNLTYYLYRLDDISLRESPQGDLP